MQTLLSTVVMITAVYIPPEANSDMVLEQLHNSITNQQNKYPDAVCILAGHFNNVELKFVLPKFYQHV